MYGRADRELSRSAAGAADRPSELAQEDLDAARLGLLQVLRKKRMSPQFIERHADDLLAQAAFEYSRKLAEGVAIKNPVGWMIVCGWHRTINLLEARDWTPTLVSAELGQELIEEAEEGPEDSFLTGDRYRKVREAVEQLPSYQRRLLALSYFEGESVREAARRLGWSASKAQRAHESARRRLHELLGVDSSDAIGFEVGVAAYASLAGGHGSGLTLPSGLEAVLDHLMRGAERALELARHPFGSASQGANVLVSHSGGRRFPNLGRRLLGSGAAEAGAAAASDGGQRVFEVCKYAAVCAIGAGAITTAVVAPHHQRAPAHRHHKVQRVKRSTATSSDVPDLAAHEPTAIPVEAASSTAISEVSESSSSQSSSAGKRKPAPSRAQRRATARRSEERQSESEFAASAKAASEADGSVASTPSSAATTSSDEPSEVVGSDTTSTAVSGESGEDNRKALRQFRGPLR